MTNNTKVTDVIFVTSFVWLVVVIGLLITIDHLNDKIADLNKPTIIYKVDSAGGVTVGKVTAKEIINDMYIVEVKPYGNFLVTREQYEAIKIGDEMPECLKGRGS